MTSARAVLAAVLLLVLQGTGLAATGSWLRAESAHFILYGREREAVMRQTALDLETYQDTMLRATGLKEDGRPAPKLEIYLARGRKDMDDALPGAPEGVRGIYQAEAEMVAALAIFTTSDSPGGLSGIEALFHEYAHHFMFQHSASAYPTWYAEGFAEYFAATQIAEETVTVGAIPDYRAAGLVLGRWLPLKTVLFGSHWGLAGADGSQFYGESWLLTHYLFATAERNAKLQRYLALLNDGTPALTAFREAFGMEVEALDQALQAYAKGKLMALRLARQPSAGTVAVTALPPSADTLLLLDYRVKTGLHPTIVQDTLTRIRKHAAEYPGDRLAQLTLARAEIFYGDAPAGEAIAEAALAAAPDDPDWLYLKGTGELKRGYLEPEAREAHYKAGRRALARANKIRPNHVPTLYRYARSFFGEPGEPSENTTNILMEAAQIAPQVGELSITASYALMVRNDFDPAVRLLKAVANAPHGGPVAEKARMLLRSAEKKELPQATSAYLGGK